MIKVKLTLQSVKQNVNSSVLLYLPYRLLVNLMSAT